MKLPNKALQPTRAPSARAPELRSLGAVAATIVAVD
jgi:hypothetical protein